MDSTDSQPQPQQKPQQQPQHQSQPQPQLQPQQQHLHQHQQHPQHQQQHQYNLHTQHQRQPLPPNTQQQQHIQQQSQTQMHQQSAHPSQHQYAQPAGYPTHTMQFSPLPQQQHYHQRHPYQQAQYAANISYAAPLPYAYPPQPYTAWQPPAHNYVPPQAATPSSKEATSTPPVVAPLTPRPKTKATIKDPKTKQEVDLEEELKSSIAKTTSTQSSTITTSTVVTTKNNPTTPANTNNATDAVTTSSTDRTNTSSPPSVSNILLQKVSEDTNPEKCQVAATTITTEPTSAKASVTPPTIKPATTTKPLPIVSPTPVTATAAEIISPTKIAKEAQVQVEVKKVTSCPETKEADVPLKKDTDIDVVISDKLDNVIDIKSGDIKEEKEGPAGGDAQKDVVNLDGNDSTNDGKEHEDEVKPEDKIALSYESGQYNPMKNRRGKKKYSRQFLVDVCEKICKLSVFDDDKPDNSMEGYNFNNQVDMFTPHYSRPISSNYQNDQSRRPNQQNYMGRSSAGQERQRKVIASSSLTTEVELKTVENPWRPGKEKKEDIPIDVVEVDVLKKKFRSILNKLTPNNFDNLSVAVTDLHIDTETKLGEVIDIVFAKALAEPGYCTLYGKMCCHLKQITAGTAHFGSTLLQRCQYQFQSDIYSGLNLDERKKKIEEESDPEIKKHLNEELYEEMFRCRMRGLGLIKFIGELYKIGMLNDTIMMDCITRLLTDTSEESLECLCDLLATIGERLDKSSRQNAKEEKKAHKAPPKANAYSSGKTAASVVASGGNAQQKAANEPVATLDDIFDQLHKIRTNKDLSMRIKFKLLDVCELREKNHWQSKNTKDNEPKMIAEIKKAHEEKLESEKERRNQNAMGPRRSQEGRRGLGHSSGSSSQISSLTNESGVNRGGAQNMHASASSHSIRDHSDDNMKQNNSDSLDSQKEHQRAKATLSTVLNRITSAPNQGENSLRPSFLRPVPKSAQQPN